MDQILCKSDLPKLSKSPKIDAHELMPPANGLSTSKLKQANADSSDVISGKTFYAGDKNLKTGSFNLGAANANPWEVLQGKSFYSNNNKSLQYGTVMDSRTASSIRLDSDNDIPLFYGIDGSFRYNTDGGYRYCIWSNLGGQRVFVDGTNTWICLSIDDYKLPSNIGWQYKIDPGGSIVIPKGYHDGEHRVYASSIQDVVKRGTVSHFFIGSDWAQRATLHCAGTVLGITDVRGTGSTYIDQSVTFNGCPDGRGIRIRISGSDILVEADNLVSTNTMWIDYVYI